MRELPEKLRRILKPKLLPVVFLLVFFLAAGFFAITQEPGEQKIQEQGDPGEELSSIEPGFVPVRVPRWFRSNAGGMALEETPSRLGALRNKYALVIDYAAIDELDTRLTPFYKDGDIIETRVLYEDGKESRKQWLLLDESGNVMVNAVFMLTQDSAVHDESGDEPPAPDGRTSIGFIEVYNEKGRIVRDYTLFEDGGEILTGYFYNEGVLVRAETRERDSETVEYRKTYTDTYRYNRSYSLRNVERVFHEAAGIDPVTLVFPGRVLDAAREKDFMRENLIITSDFLDIRQTDAGSRMVFDTDSKGRVMGETLYNSKDEVIWTVKNTWVGDRVTAILKIEGNERKLTEYDYDRSGNRIAQRDIRNGILERQVFINGNKETEELYMDGAVALRAFWEDGRKISEERIRRR